MDKSHFGELLELGEIGGVEFKASMPLRSPKPWRIIRAVLALSNRRDGGWIIVGVAQDENDRPRLDGMSDQHLESWSEDNLTQLLSNYGEPRPQVRFEIYEYNKAGFVVIDVREFETQPILCKKNGGDEGSDTLREGALYIRPRGKAQTVENGSMEDMRDVLNLATEKRLRDLLSTVARSGASLQILSDESLETGATYDTELEGYLDDI